MNDALEVIFGDDVQKIFDHFSSAFDLKILFYSRVGEIIKVGLNRPNSLYCRLMQNKLFGIGACVDQDREGRELAKALGATFGHTCHAGVRDFFMPIDIEGNLLGYVGFGQFRHGRNVPSGVMREWIRKGRNPATLRAAFLKLPSYTEGKEADIKELFSFLLNYIVSQRMIIMKGDVVLHKALSHIYSHIDGDIRLNDVAMGVRRSRSTVSHLFKTKLNKGFKKTVLDIRFSKAEEYLRMVPHLKIREVAEKVGYGDPLHFSRIFKKHRGLSPSQFVQRSSRD